MFSVHPPVHCCGQLPPGGNGGNPHTAPEPVLAIADEEIDVDCADEEAFVDEAELEADDADVGPVDASPAMEELALDEVAAEMVAVEALAVDAALVDAESRDAAESRAPPLPPEASPGAVPEPLKKHEPAVDAAATTASEAREARRIAESYAHVSSLQLRSAVRRAAGRGRVHERRRVHDRRTLRGAVSSAAVDHRVLADVGAAGEHARPRSVAVEVCVLARVLALHTLERAFVGVRAVDVRVFASVLS